MHTLTAGNFQANYSAEVTCDDCSSKMRFCEQDIRLDIVSYKGLTLRSTTITCGTCGTSIDVKVPYYVLRRIDKGQGLSNSSMVLALLVLALMVVACIVGSTN